MKKLFTTMVLLLALLLVGKAQTPLFSEGFESGIPTTWRNLSFTSYPSEANNLWFVFSQSGYPYSGSRCAASASYNNSTALHPDNWLITPAIQIPQGIYDLTYWVAPVHPNYPFEHYAIMITTNTAGADNPNNYTMLYEETIDASTGAGSLGTWKQKTVSLAAYAGQTVNIAFRHYDCTDQYYLLLDEVKIDLGSTDPRMEVSATNIHFPSAPIDSTFSNEQFSVTGFFLTDPVTITMPTGTPFSISSDGTNYSNSITLTPNNGTVNGTIRVKFAPTVANYYATEITVAGETGTWIIPVDAMVVGSCDQPQNISWYETFTTTDFPANCWTMTSTDTNDYVSEGQTYPGVKRYTWYHSVSSQYAAVIGDDDAYQDEHLYTPTFTLSNNTGAADFAFDFRTNPNIDAMVEGLVKLDVNMSLDGGNTYTNVWSSQDIRAEFAENWSSWDDIWNAHINMDQYLGTNNQIKFDFHFVADSGAADQVIIQNVRFLNYHDPRMAVNAEDTMILFTYVNSPEAIVIPVEGRNLTAAINVTATAPFEVSNNGTSFATTATLPTPGGNVYLRYNPTATGSNNGTLTISSNYTDTAHVYADTTLSFSFVLIGNAYDCSVITLPLTESFESNAEDIYAPNTTEYCWSAIKGNTADANNNLINADDNAYTGSKSFRFSSIRMNKDGIYDQYLITPELQATSPMTVMFNYANSSTLKDEVFCVGYSTTGKEISDFTWEADINNTANYEWQLYRKTDVPANVKYVAVHYKSVNKEYLYIDNFQIKVTPSCIAPVSVRAESTNTTSANITWTAGANENEWEMVYGTAPLNVASATTVAVNTLGTTINNLTANTHYQVALRAVCGTNTSDWSEVADFWTTTTPATIPYTQTFESSDPDRANWVLVNGSEPNYFMFGTIPASTSGAGLIITRNGTTNEYIFQNGEQQVSNYSTVWAYRDIQFPETTAPNFIISLNWKCNGEVDYDFGELFIGNATEVTNFERDNEKPGYVDVNTMHYVPAGLTKLGRFVGTTSMQASAFLIPAEQVAGKVQRLYVLWTNDSLSGSDTPLGIDNVNIKIPEFCNLSGTVLHDMTQNPIAGAVVTAVNSDNGFSQTTVSDNNGHYSFQNLVAGLFEISASANGYVTTTLTQPLMNGENTLTIEMSLEPCVIMPANITSEIEADNLILSWDGISSGVIKKCNSEANVNAIGGPSEFGCFHRFTPGNLAQYNGASITSIGAFFNALASEGVTYKLQIYIGNANTTGPSSDIPVYEQDVDPTLITGAGWVDVPLETPYLINGSQYLWVGYILYDEGDGNHPAGVTDNGSPAGDGNIMLASGTWTNLPTIAESLTYNWQIRATVVAPDLHYNILEDDEIIANNISGTEYVVASYDPSACYQVATVCENGMVSNPSDCISVGINNVDNNTTFEVYPNPAHETVNVTTTMDVQKVEVLNYLGQVIYSQNTTNNNFTLNVANYADGVYFIRLSGNDGIATQKLIKK